MKPPSPRYSGTHWPFRSQLNVRTQRGCPDHPLHEVHFLHAAPHPLKPCLNVCLQLRVCCSSPRYTGLSCSLLCPHWLGHAAQRPCSAKHCPVNERMFTDPQHLLCWLADHSPGRVYLELPSSSHEHLGFQEVPGGHVWLCPSRAGCRPCCQCHPQNHPRVAFTPLSQCLLHLTSNIPGTCGKTDAHKNSVAEGARGPGSEHTQGSVLQAGLADSEQNEQKLGTFAIA